MLRNKIYILFFFINCSLLWGQRSIPSSFPEPGRSISMSSFSYSGFLNMEDSGENDTWDFLFLQAPYITEIAMEYPESGKLSERFPDAERMMLLPNGKEIYYKFSGPNVIEVGRSFNQWVLDWVEKGIDFETNPIVKKAGMVLNDTYTDNSSYNITLGVEELPKHFSKKLPLLIDSVQYEVTINKNSTIDSEGTLLMPNVQYQVIREFEHLNIVVRGTCKTAAGWKEIKDILPNITAEDEKYISHERSIHIYKYWSDAVGVPVLSIEDYGDEEYNISFVTDRNNDYIPVIKAIGKSTDVIAHPNPTYGEISFQLVNLPPGKYELRILSLVNKKLYSKETLVGNDRLIHADLSFLSKGTYIYNIIDEKGNNITTKRIVIITP